jgi:hypothetical protein
MDRFEEMLARKLKELKKKDPAADKKDGVDAVNRDKFLARTDAMISEIKKLMPNWVPKSHATGIWIFGPDGSKEKYLVEEICTKERTDPKSVIAALQSNANEDGYGIMILANTLLANTDETTEDGEEAPMCTEEANEMLHRLSEDPDAIDGMPRGLLVYRETKDGYMDLMILRVKPGTKEVSRYMKGVFSSIPIETLVNAIGLKTFGVSDAERKAGGNKGWIIGGGPNIS